MAPQKGVGIRLWFARPRDATHLLHQTRAALVALRRGFDSPAATHNENYHHVDELPYHDYVQ